MVSSAVVAFSAFDIFCLVTFVPPMFAGIAHWAVEFFRCAIFCFVTTFGAFMANHDSWDVFVDCLGAPVVLDLVWYDVV